MNITIVIPYYKLSFFEATLKSLVEQTNKHFSVVIGDDASPEDPKPLLDHYKGQIDYKYHRFDDNLGSISLVAQWNRCIDLIDNDTSWILILGDDDVLGPNVIKEFYKNLDEITLNKINVVRYSTVVINEDGKEITRVFNNKKIIAATEAFYDKISDQSRSSLGEYIFKKSVYDEIGFKEYGLAWHSDDMAWLDFSNFKNLFCIDTEKIYIRVSDKSISGGTDNSSAKIQASFLFYHDLVYQHLNKFKWSQRNLLLRIYESKLLPVKGKSFATYFQMILLFAKNGFFVSVLRFSIRFFIKY